MIISSSSLVIRSSTDKLQDVYAKAKETSLLIRLPCNIAETVVDTSLKVVQTVVNPFVKPFSGPGKYQMIFIEREKKKKTPLPLYSSTCY